MCFGGLQRSSIGLCTACPGNSRGTDSGNGKGEDADHEGTEASHIGTASEAEPTVENADAVAGGAPTTPQQKGKGKKRAAGSGGSMPKTPVQRIDIEKGIMGVKAARPKKDTSPQGAISGPKGTLMEDARRQLAENDSSDDAMAD